HLATSHLFSTTRATFTTSPLSLHDALPIWKRFHALLKRRVDPRRSVLAAQQRERQAATTQAQPHDRQCPLLADDGEQRPRRFERDRKSTRLNSSHVKISYAVFCLKKQNDHE